MNRRPVWDTEDSGERKRGEMETEDKRERGDIKCLYSSTHVKVLMGKAD